MSADQTRTVGVRLRPHVIERLREELGLPQGTKDAEMMRAAVHRLTGIAPEEMTSGNGGRRAGAGRKPRPRAA